MQLNVVDSLLEKVLSNLDDALREKFKTLRQKAPLRYGYCSVWNPKVIDAKDYERKSIISVLCTEKSKWEAFLKKIDVQTPKEALYVFLILLLLYGNSPYDRSRVEKTSEFWAEQLRQMEIGQIPEYVLHYWISSNNQGDPEDPDASFREPAVEIIKNFVVATVIRVLKVLEKWNVAPYSVCEYEVANGCRSYWIKLQDVLQNDEDLRISFETLPVKCYNELIKGEISRWKPSCSLWRFIEEKIQGMSCDTPNNPENDLLGVNPHNRGQFTNGSILWIILNDKKILRTRSEVEFVCAECGGKLLFSPASVSIDDPVGNDNVSSLSDFLSNDARKVEDGDGWRWAHCLDCRYLERGEPGKFLVRHDDRLYFPSMLDYEPYQTVRCLRCNNCSEEHNDHCVSPVSTNRNCFLCDSPLGEGYGTTVAAPNCSYIKNDVCDVSPSVRKFLLLVFQNETFEDFSQRISLSPDEHANFENDIENFYKRQENIEIGRLRFKRDVKSMLIVREFGFWIRTQENRARQLGELFEDFWNSNSPLKTIWGVGVKERTLQFAKYCFNNQGEEVL